MLPYTFPRKPASRLVICSGDNAVDGDQYFSNTAPLSHLLSAVGPPFKNSPVSLYDGDALIVPEGGNTRGICRPPHFGHRRSGCRPRRNRLATEAYPQSILPDGQKYREWKAIPKVQPSSWGDRGLPLGRGYCSAPEVAKSASVALTGTVVVDPLLIVIFLGFSLIPPHI